MTGMTDEPVEGRADACEATCALCEERPSNGVVFGSGFSFPICAVCVEDVDLPGWSDAPSDADEPEELVTDGGRDVWYEPVGADDPDIQTGDVVVDLATGSALQVVSKSATSAGEHSRTRSDATAELFGVKADDPVFNCVFLPDGERISPPSKTYAYPASRLLRYPVEQAADGRHLQTHLRVAFLEDLAAAAARSGNEQTVAVLEDLLADAFDQDLAQLVREFAEAVGEDADD